MLGGTDTCEARIGVERSEILTTNQKLCPMSMVFVDKENSQTPHITTGKIGLVR
jgi:hypothetical protein